MTFPILRGADQAFCRRSLCWKLPNWLLFVYFVLCWAGGGGRTQRRSSVSLTLSVQSGPANADLDHPVGSWSPGSPQRGLCPAPCFTCSLQGSHSARPHCRREEESTYTWHLDLIPSETEALILHQIIYLNIHISLDSWGLLRTLGCKPVLL